MAEKMENEGSNESMLADRDKGGEGESSLENEQVTKVDHEEMETVVSASEQGDEEQLTSLDMLWRHVFMEVDEWVKRAESRDQALWNAAQDFVSSIDRNQENLGAAADLFKKELAEWERMAREEFFMSTTAIQHFFPIRSFENINQQMDQIQSNILSLLDKPCQILSNNLSNDHYLRTIDQLISLRKRARYQYIQIIKQAGHVIYENQRGFVKLITNQVRTLMFPLNKYLEETEELTKS